MLAYHTTSDDSTVVSSARPYCASPSMIQGEEPLGRSEVRSSYEGRKTVHVHVRVAHWRSSAEIGPLHVLLTYFFSEGT